MEYVQVRFSRALKLAVFFTAFFSSFFSNAFKIDYSVLDFKGPKVVDNYTCIATTNNVVLDNAMTIDGCNAAKAFVVFQSTRENGYYRNMTNVVYESNRMFVDYEVCADWVGWNSSCYNDTYFVIYHYAVVVSALQGTTKACPPDNYLDYTHSRDTDNDGEVDSCYKESDIQSQFNEQIAQNKEDNYCSSLVLDVGNNNGAAMCYTAPNGVSCEIKSNFGAGYSYYEGGSSNPLGCSSSSNPPYDQSGTGNSSDGCIFDNGKNYCKADSNKHKDAQGNLDEGCFEGNGVVYCDTSKYNDVGEGESDYFDDEGTCSVVSGSSSKGYCEEMGGIWDKTTDYQETSCPSGGGTCSVPTGGFCGACMDAGGTWTPDNNQQLSNEAKSGLEVATQVKKTNEKLTQIEAGQRKTTEALISTFKTGNQKITGLLDALVNKKNDSKAIVKAIEDKKESYSTSTGSIDKTKFNSLFSVSSLTSLKAEVETLKTQLSTQLRTSSNELKTLMTVTVPNSSGYQVRNLTLTTGSFDMSLTRFSTFFQLLSGAIMFICTVYAAFIILGGDR